MEDEVKLCKKGHQRTSDNLTGVCKQCIEAYYHSPEYEAFSQSPDGMAHLKTYTDAYQQSLEYKGYLDACSRVPEYATGMKRPKEKAIQMAYLQSQEYKAYMDVYTTTPDYKAYMEAYLSTTEYKTFQKKFLEEMYLTAPDGKINRRISLTTKEEKAYQKTYKDLCLKIPESCLMTPEYKSYRKAYMKTYMDSHLKTPEYLEYQKTFVEAYLTSAEGEAYKETYKNSKISEYVYKKLFAKSSVAKKLRSDFDKAYRYSEEGKAYKKRIQELYPESVWIPATPSTAIPFQLTQGVLE